MPFRRCRRRKPGMQVGAWHRTRCKFQDQNTRAHCDVVLLSVTPQPAVKTRRGISTWLRVRHRVTDVSLRNVRACSLTCINYRIQYFLKNELEGAQTSEKDEPWSRSFAQVREQRGEGVKPTAILTLAALYIKA